MARDYQPDISFDQPIPAKVPKVRIVQVAHSDYVVQVREPDGRWEKHGNTAHSLATALQEVQRIRNPFVPRVVAVYED